MTVTDDEYDGTVRTSGKYENVTNDKRKENGWETTEPYKDVLFAPSALIQGMLYVRIKIRTAS